MRQLFVLGLSVGLLAAASPPATAGFAPMQAACRGATATREYTADAMTFRLHLDLDGCRWWDGSARNLVIYVSRDDGATAASRWSMTPCESGADPGGSRTSVCEVFSTVRHPAEERDVVYQGEATWKWQDGERRISFETRCSTTKGQAHCDDPVATWHD